MPNSARKLARCAKPVNLTVIDQEQTFLSHLVELRDRLLRAILAILVVFLCLMPWASEIYDFLAHPMMLALPEGTKMIATGVVTPFLVPVKVTIMVAFVIVLPIVLYQAWAFIAPGLYAHEKRLGLPLVIASTLLFIVGMAFCYFFVFGVVFKFINEFAPKSITPAPDIEQYLSFVLTMFIAFGVTFEVPVIVIVLVRMGIVSLQKLREIRPYAIVGAFVIAAVVTPPDVMSQLLLAIPLVLLFEVGLLLARFVKKPAAESDYTALTDQEMERELDQADADSRKNPP
jgi:sec-independent protein translocase protein TatC